MGVDLQNSHYSWYTNGGKHIKEVVSFIGAGHHLNLPIYGYFPYTN